MLHPEYISPGIVGQDAGNVVLLNVQAKAALHIPSAAIKLRIGLFTQIPNHLLYYPTNALNYMNYRIFKNTLKL